MCSGSTSTWARKPYLGGWGWVGVRLCVGVGGQPEGGVGQALGGRVVVSGGIGEGSAGCVGGVAARQGAGGVAAQHGQPLRLQPARALTSRRPSSRRPGARAAGAPAQLPRQRAPAPARPAQQARPVQHPAGAPSLQGGPIGHTLICQHRAESRHHGTAACLQACESEAGTKVEPGRARGWGGAGHGTSGETGGEVRARSPQNSR